MRSLISILSMAALVLCAIVFNTSMAMAQSTIQRNPLRALKRAITEANAPALSTEQETQITALITQYQAALPDEPDEALQAARDAFNAALVAGDQAAAQTQAALIANRTAELLNARLNLEAQFTIGVFTVLKSGGQFDPLQQKFGDDRLLALVESLNNPHFGRGGSGPGRR